jgi:hypothetical protein
MSRRLIHRLLAGRRGLGRAEKDDIFSAVMRQVEPAPSRRRWLAPVLALAGAAAALVIAPLALRRSDPPADVTARGAAPSATFAAFCADGPCRLGDTLLLDVAPGEWSHFAAFARRDDGTVVWYRSGAADDAALRPGVLATGIVLDEVHGHGTYRVYGVFSRAPLARAEIRARFQPEADGAAASAGPETAVVVRELVVR